MAGGPVQSIYFDKLTGGEIINADPFTIGPQSYPHSWSSCINLISWRGRLQRREGVAGSMLYPIEPPEGASDDFPMLIVGFSFNEIRERFLIVTTRELWIGQSGGLESIFDNITPVYPGPGVSLSDTITASTGSTAITGAAGDFLTRGIAPGNILVAQGGHYVISSVNSESSLTLASNYLGGGGSGLDFTIRRTFHAGGYPTSSARDLYAAAVALNGDIYVTIRDGGVAYFGGTEPSYTGIVLKIDRGADSTKTSFTDGDVHIVMSTEAMTSETYALQDSFVPRGLEVLEDGRLVLAAHVYQLMNDPGTVGDDRFRADNRILYSSHLDPFNWGQPGGFVDLIGARGAITGMKRMGGSLAVHFHDQVVMGQITGGDSSPFTWRSTRATCGAAAPRLILPVPATANLPGGQIFLSTTGDLHLFDGDQSLRLPTSWADTIRDEASLSPNDYFRMHGIARSGHLNYDEHRRSVSMFAQIEPSRSAELRFDLETGVNSTHMHPNIISATNEPRIQPYGESVFIGSAPIAGLTYCTRIIGIRGTDLNAIPTAYLYTHSLEALNDSLLPTIALGIRPGGVRLETHDLMLGAPDRQGRVLRVILWYVGRATVTETIYGYLSVDSGLTWELGVGATTIALTAPQVGSIVTEENYRNPRGPERRVQFHFSTSAPAERARLRLWSDQVDLDSFNFALTRMMIDYVHVADVRALP